MMLGRGCNEGGAHDNLRERGAGGEGVLYCPVICQAPPPRPPLTIHPPLLQCVWQGSEYLTLHLRETYSTSGDINVLHPSNCLEHVMCFKIIIRMFMMY